MDPPNVLWFFGTFAIWFAVFYLLSRLPDSRSGLWVFLVALGFFAAFALASLWLFRGGWWIPGGLAVTVAVATFPGVAVGFLDLIGVWPDDAALDPFADFNGYPFGVAVATAIVGIVAYLVTRFPFIWFVVVSALLLASQLLVAAFEGSPSGEDRATAALVAGSLAVIVGVFLDAFGRRRGAFWFHALGWFSVAAGLAFFAANPSGDRERGWVPILIVSLLMLIASGPIRRATWAVYGVLGYYASIVHYLVDAFDEDGSPFALMLLALGLSIFLQGMLLHRYGKAWGERYIRRPPPAVLPPH